MSKHINMSGLKTLLEPLVHLINKKAERPDWNENDPSSSSYIANKTHYVETRSRELLDTSISFDSNGVYEIQPSSFSLQEGKSYKVIWDGITYDCIARNDGQDDIYIGNQEFAAILEGWYFPEVIESNEPFFIATWEEENWLIFFGVEGNHTITLVGEGITIYKIDEKYLPKLIGAKSTGENAEIFNDYHGNEASGTFSHAEGVDTQAGGYAAHVEGGGTLANGKCSHAEGWYTEANGYNSHAEGSITEASGDCSHAEGYYTIAYSQYQHVQGKYNVKDSASIYAHIVGNGKYSKPSNAHTLDWNGNAWFAGDVYVGSTSGTNKDEGSKKLATESYVDEKLALVISNSQIDALFEDGFFPPLPNANGVNF